MAQAVSTLFLSYDGLTDPLGQSQVLPYLAGLSEAGYNIHIISFEKKDRRELLGEKIMDLCKEKGISWHPLEYHKSPPVLSTLYDLYSMRKKAEALHAKFKFQLVHARSYPPALVALGLKNKLNIPYLFDIRGFWPEERVEGGIWNLGNPVFRTIYTYFKRKEVELYKKAAAVITLTHKAKEILLDRSDLKPLPEITVIPCCADMDHFNPDKINIQEVQIIRERLQLQPEDYVLCYVGSIGTWYMLEEMLQFYRTLKMSQPKAKFLFISPDSKEYILKAAEQQQVLREDLRIVSAAYREVPAYIAAAQAAVFFIRPSYSKQASSPTKQGELLAMGKPIVTNAGVGDSDNILQKTNGGVLLKEFTKTQYQVAANQLLAVAYQGLEVRARSAEIYALSKGVEKYKDIYTFMLSTR
jgi:glycosyltransferase involved in cell wall biosynthesis